MSRDQAPRPGTLRPFHIPPTEAFALRSGLEVRAIPMSQVPLVTAALVLPAREASLRPDQAGLVTLCAAGLDGGTARRDARQLAEAFENLGTALVANAGWDATTLSFTCLTEHLPDVLDLLAEVVEQSVFPEGEFARARDQQLARIRQRSMDPTTLTSDWAARLTYSDSSPYCRPAMGRPATVERQDRTAAQALVRERYRPRGAALVLAGDVDLSGLPGVLEACFAAWEGVAIGTADAPSAPRTTERTLHLVHRPGALQSELRVGHPGPPRDHPDYFDLVVANTVLGGAFTSRLNATLRERHGYTYGARSRFGFRRGPGPFSATTSVGTEVTAPALRAMLDELERFAADGATADEIDAARDYVAGVFPLAMETTSQLAGHAAELLIYDLPADHHVHYRDRIRAVTPESARAAVQRHLRPGELTLVVSGDQDTVRGPLESLGIAPLQLHEGDA